MSVTPQNTAEHAMLKFAARSDVGRVRSKNDDSAYVGRYLAVVADGMGGHVGGDVASASTVLDLAPLDRREHADPQNILADEIQSANLILNDLVNTNPKLSGMGTTCTAVLVDGTQLHLAHIGDSRAYRLKDDHFEQITIDHTFVQRLIDEGRITPEEAETHPHKNVLMRVLGDVDASPELDVATFDTTFGERWLLCSDGLNAVVPDTVIAEKMRTVTELDDLVDELVEATLAGGSPDNVTIVAFEVVPEDAEAALLPAAVDTTELTATARALATADPDDPVSAELLRQDLRTRPHLLVGAANLATDTDQIPIVTRSSSTKRATALLHGGTAVSTPASPTGASPSGVTPGAPAPAAQSTAPGVLAGAGAGTGSVAVPTGNAWTRNWPLLTALIVIIGLVLAAAGFGYVWTQNQYYVGANGDQVAIYRGVPQNLGPLSLSEVEQESDIPLDRLPGYTRQRVESGLSAQDLSHAQDMLTDLEAALIPEAPPLELPSPVPDDPNFPEVDYSEARVAISGAAAGAIAGDAADAPAATANPSPSANPSATAADQAADQAAQEQEGITQP